MIIKDKLKVLGKFINVVKKETLDDEGDLGEWDGPKKTINLRNDLGEDESEVFMHEIFEVINDRCDLQLKHSQLSTLSEVLWQIITDNDLDFR